MEYMIVHNEDVKKVIAEVPQGHRHVRTILVLQDGIEITFQEATIANIVRAYITVKTHPTKNKVTLKGQQVMKRKKDYAAWQLLEE
jgi:hypothetical protein